MRDIRDNMKQILDAGSDILFELEKEEPELDKLKQLYEHRSIAVEKLSSMQDLKANDLSESEKKAIESLFSQLRQLEKKLNKGLAVLSDARQEALNNLVLHKKAKSLYSDTSPKVNHQRKIVDLKTYA